MKNNLKTGFHNKLIKLAIGNIYNCIVLNKNQCKEIMMNLFKKELGLFIIGLNFKNYKTQIIDYVKMNF